MLNKDKDQGKRKSQNRLNTAALARVYLVPPAGIEPATPGLGILCSIPWATGARYLLTHDVRFWDLDRWQNVYIHYLGRNFHEKWSTRTCKNFACAWFKYFQIWRVELCWSICWWLSWKTGTGGEVKMGKRKSSLKFWESFSGRKRRGVKMPVLWPCRNNHTVYTAQSFHCTLPGFPRRKVFPQLKNTSCRTWGMQGIPPSPDSF